MSEVSRWVVVTDDDPLASHNVVECAVRQDLSSPAREFVDQMGSGTWKDDPHFAGAPDEGQIYDMAKFVSEAEYIAHNGFPSRMSAVNHLRDGIWELKFGKHRLAYFDTPGDGTFTPKPPPSDSAEVPLEHQNEFWQYPHMDQVLRLSNGFGKTDQKTEPQHIESARQIRDEDVAHDK